jgi:hypothetical protein
VVIADARKMAGYPVGPVADYIAMLVLTKTRSLDGCGELPSILDLLASNCRPGNQAAALTEADTGFLNALYSIDMNLAASMQRSRIRKQMLRDLGGSSGATHALHGWSARVRCMHRTGASREAPWTGGEHAKRA